MRSSDRSSTRGNNLASQIADGDAKLDELEQQLLASLANSTGNILDDVPLIAALEASHDTSAATAAASRRRLRRATTSSSRRTTAPSRRAASLFFATAELASIDTMYQTSLDDFARVFAEALKGVGPPQEAVAAPARCSPPPAQQQQQPPPRDGGGGGVGVGVGGGGGGAEEEAQEAEEDQYVPVVALEFGGADGAPTVALTAVTLDTSAADAAAAAAAAAAEAEAAAAARLEARLEVLCEAATFAVFSRVSRGLFARHKPIYGMALAAAIARERGELPAAMWCALLQTAPTKKAAERAAAAPNPAATWLDARAWAALHELHSPGMSGVLPSLREDHARGAASVAVRRRCRRARCSQKLAPFALLLLRKALRPETTPEATARYVAATLGDRYLEAPGDAQSACDDADGQTLIVLLLASGADPTAQLVALARQRGWWRARASRLSPSAKGRRRWRSGCSRRRPRRGRGW